MDFEAKTSDKKARPRQQVWLGGLATQRGLGPTQRFRVDVTNDNLVNSHITRHSHEGIKSLDHVLRVWGREIAVPRFWTNDCHALFADLARRES